MLKKIFLSLLFAAFIFAGVADAHGGKAEVVSTNKVEVRVEAGMLPGNPFYFLEMLSERIGNFFTFNEIKKADRLFNLAEERLAEAEELADLGKSQRAEKATEKYEKYLAKALKKVEKAKEKGKDTDEVLVKIAEGTVKHQLKLAEVHEKVSKEAKEAIEHTMEESMKGYDKALEAISKEKQNEIELELNQILEEVDSVFEELGSEERYFPKIKGREHGKYNDNEDEFDNMDDELKDLNDDLEDDSDNFEDDIGDELDDNFDDEMNDNI